MMVSNMRRLFLVVVFSMIAGAGALAWADHGHGGGGHGGGGGGGHGGGGGWSHGGGNGHVSYGHFGGYGGGYNNYWGGGGGRYYSGYRNYGWPYSYYRNNYYRPYVYGYFGYPYVYGYGGYPSAYYGYPSYSYSYPSDYFANGGDYYDGGTAYDAGAAPPAYVVSRPVSDVARVEIRLPDPQGTLWVEGQEISSSGSVRKFRSPQLDPSQPYTYTVKAAWNENGKVVTDERRVKVQANDLAVVDFSQPIQAAPDVRRPAMPDLPPPQPRPTVE